MKNIDRKVKKDIIDLLKNGSPKIYGHFEISGRLREIDFLNRIYELKKMPSHDNRYKNAYDDIYQHTVNNDDYEINFFLNDERFELLDGKDEIFLKFLCEVFSPFVRNENSSWEQYLDLVNCILKSTGYKLILDNEPLQECKYIAFNASLDRLNDLGKTINNEYIAKKIKLIEKYQQTDIELCIGTSKELIESVCKYILNEFNIPINDDWDITGLSKETFSVLKIMPKDVDDSIPLAGTFKKVLGNLLQVISGIAEIRNKYGSGHGKIPNHKGLEERHAKMVVGATTTLVWFLWDTYLYKK